jgi:hypothetical protein
MIDKVCNVAGSGSVAHGDLSRAPSQWTRGHKPASDGLGLVRHGVARLAAKDLIRKVSGVAVQSKKGLIRKVSGVAVQSKKGLIREVVKFLQMRPPCSPRRA